LAAHPVIVRFAQQQIGGRKMILNSQNGIINRPGRRHYQSAWHRDLPYQTFVASRPLAISVLFALDPFTAETGGTQVLPSSHLHEQFPDQAYVESHLVTPFVPAGAALAFNSMLFHRGGENRSEIIRRGVNHVYSIPLMAPQVALHDLECDGDATLHMLLGKDFIIPASAVAWRERKWSALALRQQKQTS
jgi:ectoine hydroxylase-related dioxygenase (phytanoyl-CoA dioxygenase family)